MPFHEAPWCEEKTTSLDFFAFGVFGQKYIYIKNQILLQDCESFLLGSSLRLRHGHTTQRGCLPPPHLVPVQDHFVTFCHFLEFHTSQYKNTPRFRFCTPFFWRLAVSRGAHVISVCSTAALPLLGHRNVAASSSTHSRFTFACRRYHRHSAQCLPSGVFESCVWCSRFLASL